MDRHDVPTLIGERVRLRRARSNDIDACFALGRDPDIFEMFGVSRNDVEPMTRAAAERWVQGLLDHPFAWVIELGTAIGEIRLDRLDPRDRKAALAVGIFDRNALGRGIGTEAMLLVLDYAFRVLDLHRIGVRVLAFNERAIRAYEKCGFLVEGREREAGFVNGKWHDDVIMGLLDRDFALVAERTTRSRS